MKKVLFIVGPTASGKTKLAFTLAKKFKGELVSGDSVQVYKGLDIISGKDIPQSTKFINLKDKIKNISPDFNIGHYSFNNIPIFLLDLVEPIYNFSVNDFLKISIPVIDYIWSRGELPIVVGGTGFYIKALVDGIETLNIPQNGVLREELSNKTVEELSEILKKEDPERLQKMTDSDKKNKRRLVRAIEIARFIKSYSLKEPKKLEEIDSFFVGLFAEREIIKRRIDERVKQRIRDGAIAEAEKLFKNFKNLSNSVKTANGYRQLFDYLDGRFSLVDAIEKWKRSEYLNAKKQMTWFKKDKRIHWFNIADKDFIQKIETQVKDWYNT